MVVPGRVGIYQQEENTSDRRWFLSTEDPNGHKKNELPDHSGSYPLTKHLAIISFEPAAKRA